MSKIHHKRLGLSLLIILLTTFLFPIAWDRWIQWHFGRQIIPIDQVRPERVAIIFGARIYPDGQLSSMLRDRVEVGVQLYQAGLVDKLLLSGDNPTATYDEPGRMMDYALSRGVPAAALQPDYAGRRTYDTCYRARDIFQLESAILVTQNFHLPRALFICDQLGVDAVGVSADLHPYSRRSLAYSTLREIPARVAALVDVIRQLPAPVLGDPIPLH